MVDHRRVALQIPAAKHCRHHYVRYVRCRVRVHEYPNGTLAHLPPPASRGRNHKRADNQCATYVVQNYWLSTLSLKSVSLTLVSIQSLSRSLKGVLDFIRS
jgi:hypothetical protein